MILMWGKKVTLATGQAITSAGGFAATMSGIRGARQIYIKAWGGSVAQGFAGITLRPYWAGAGAAGLVSLNSTSLWSMIGASNINGAERSAAAYILRQTAATDETSIPWTKGDLVFSVAADCTGVNIEAWPMYADSGYVMGSEETLP